MKGSINLSNLRIKLTPFATNFISASENLFTEVAKKNLTLHLKDLNFTRSSSNLSMKVNVMYSLFVLTITVS